MPDYRRWYVPGGTYFLTIVTEKRRPILCSNLARQCLRNAIVKVRKKRPMEILSIVLMPNHLHVILTLPDKDSDYSTRIKRIKEEFTIDYLHFGGKESEPSVSRVKHGERGIWEKRYWEHLIRDENDLKRCVDYVHWNPKKHGYVSSIRDWPWSSFHKFVMLGEYSQDWGAEDPVPLYNAPEWGE